MLEVRILHTADVHLGGSGPAFGSRVREHQKRLREAFARCIDLAIHHRVQAVCVAGDLFDSPTPSEHSVQAALRELRRLGEVSPPIPAFILPGTHDSLGRGSVYHRPDFSAQHLYIFRRTEPTTLRLPDGSLAVHGHPQPPGSHAHRPLAAMRPDPLARLNIALAHGSVLRPGHVEDDSSLVSADEIAACGMDYVALGHWHGFTDQSAGRVKAAMSGAPELVLATQTEVGGALLVSFDDAGVRWERLVTGTLRSEKVILQAEECPDEAAIAAAIAGRSDHDLLLDVTIGGLAPEGFAVDVARLQAELEPQFFRLRVHDETVTMPEEISPRGVEQQLVTARVVKLFDGRIEAARAAGDAEAERRAQKALRLAMVLLQGKEVLA